MAKPHESDEIPPCQLCRAPAGSPCRPDCGFASVYADLPRPTPADFERWRVAADETPGPLGRCLRILLAEVERLRAEGERQRALLRRVRCYAVVDPLGNPAAISLPHAARMLGIESDIDAELDETDKPAPRPQTSDEISARLGSLRRELVKLNRDAAALLISKAPRPDGDGVTDDTAAIQAILDRNVKQPPVHGPTCIGLDNGCPDCIAIDRHARLSSAH